MNKHFKIITWNCQGAFRKKAGIILEHQPDILVIPECEPHDKLKFTPGIPVPSGIVWLPGSRTKGLGIFSFNGYKLKLRKTHNKDLKLIVPIAVSGCDFSFTLYAVWANHPDDPDGAYIEQVWKALHHYDRHLKRSPTILAGDFNSNTIWDRKYREGNHSHVVERLQQKNIHSTYHVHHRQAQGKEKHPTQYMYRHKDKPYHLDYCFASQDLINQLDSVEVGNYDQWKHFSDHMPVIVTFKKKE